MREFRIRENGFNEIKKRLIIMMAVMMGGIFLIVGVVPELMSDEPRWGTTLFLFLMLAIVGTFSTHFSIKKQRLIFEIFILKIDHEKIVHERLNTPVMVIYHQDITKITRQVNESFSIQGKSKLYPIRIPAQMTDYQQLEIALIS